MTIKAMTYESYRPGYIFQLVARSVGNDLEIEYAAKAEKTDVGGRLLTLSVGNEKLGNLAELKYEFNHPSSKMLDIAYAWIRDETVHLQICSA